MSEKKNKLTGFLMKYGWVALVLVIIYGALAFFDYVPPFNHDYCKISGQVKCIDITYDEGSVQMALKNIEDSELKDAQIELNAGLCTGESKSSGLGEEKIGIYSVECNETRVIKGSFEFSYVNSESGLRHKDNGRFKIFP